MTDSNKPDEKHPGQEVSAEEAIIELTEVVTEPATADEPIIELTDIAVEETEADGIPEADAAENIIELTDVIPRGEEEAGEPGEISPQAVQALDTVIADASDHDLSSDDDFADSLGVDLEGGIDPPAPPAVSTEDVEAAIERVVKEMLSDKIDTLLRKVIETEVSKEIDRIKSLLLEEAPDADDI